VVAWRQGRHGGLPLRGGGVDRWGGRFLSCPYVHAFLAKLFEGVIVRWISRVVVRCQGRHRGLPLRGGGVDRWGGRFLSCPYVHAFLAKLFEGVIIRWISRVVVRCQGRHRGLPLRGGGVDRWGGRFLSCPYVHASLAKLSESMAIRRGNPPWLPFICLVLSRVQCVRTETLAHRPARASTHPPAPAAAGFRQSPDASHAGSPVPVHR